MSLATVCYVPDHNGEWHRLNRSEDDGWWRTVCGRRIFGTAEPSGFLPSGDPNCLCAYSMEEALAFHVVDKHCNSAGIHNSYADNLDFHRHDHFGPCGLRNHLYQDLSFDEESLEKALEEAEADL